MIKKRSFGKLKAFHHVCPHEKEPSFAKGFTKRKAIAAQGDFETRRTKLYKSDL